MDDSFLAQTWRDFCYPSIVALDCECLYLLGIMPTEIRKPVGRPNEL